MILTELSNYSVKGLKVELAAAGHNYTNKLSDSIEYKFFKGGLSKIYVEDYGIDINEGYSASMARKRVGKIGADRYIEELQDWFENKLGISDEWSFAFASKTLENHLKEGYDSKRSGLNNNQGFIDFVEKSLRKAGVDIIEQKSDDLTVLLYRELLYLADKNFKITLKDVGGFSRNKNISNIF
jgi:hypothetical protein